MVKIFVFPTSHSDYNVFFCLNLRPVFLLFFFSLSEVTKLQLQSRCHCWSLPETCHTPLTSHCICITPAPKQSRDRPVPKICSLQLRSFPTKLQASFWFLLHGHQHEGRPWQQKPLVSKEFYPSWHLHWQLRVTKLQLKARRNIKLPHCIASINKFQTPILFQTKGNRWAVPFVTWDLCKHL